MSPDDLELRVRIGIIIGGGDDRPITVVIVTGVEAVVAVNINARGCCDHLLVVGSVW